MIFCADCEGVDNVKLSTTVLDDIETSENVSEDNYWCECITKNPKIFNGRILSLVSWNFQAELSELNLILRNSCYKSLLYSHFSPNWESIPEGERNNGLGVSAITVTNDYKLIIGLRSEFTGTSPGKLHFIPAGNVDCDDLEELIKRELREELRVDFQDNIDKLHVYGIFDTGREQGHKKELVFLMNLRSKSSLEILKNWEDEEEHDAIIMIDLEDCKAGNWKLEISEKYPLKETTFLVSAVLDHFFKNCKNAMNFSSC